MSNKLSPTGLAGLGIFPQEGKFYAMNRGGAVAKGQVKMVDLAASDAASTSLSIDGSTTSYIANMVVPSAGVIAGTAPGILAVALAAGADDTRVQWQIEGFVEALVIDSNASKTALAAGNGLVVNAAGELDKNAAATGAVMATGASTTGSALGGTGSATLKLVLFDGDHFRTAVR